MGKRQEQARKTRKKLMETAVNLVKTKGFDAISVEEITKAAGVGKGTFYAYFKKKEDIILEMTREPFEEINQKLREMADEPFLKKMEYYCRQFMICCQSPSIHACREWIRGVIDPNNVLNNRDGQKWDYDFAMLESIINDAVKAKELKDNTPVELLAHIIICELYGMMLCWCMSDKKFEPLDWLDKFFNTQLKKVLEPYLNKPERGDEIWT